MERLADLFSFCINCDPFSFMAGAHGHQKTGKHMRANGQTAKRKDSVLL